jgi:hypothetical protein
VRREEKENKGKRENRTKEKRKRGKNRKQRKALSFPLSSLCFFFGFPLATTQNLKLSVSGLCCLLLLLLPLVSFVTPLFRFLLPSLAGKKNGFSPDFFF